MADYIVHGMWYDKLKLFLCFLKGTIIMTRSRWGNISLIAKMEIYQPHCIDQDSKQR